MCVLFNKTLNTWVNEVHTNITKIYNSKKFKIYVEDFSFDSYACILYGILKNIDNDDIINAVQNNLDKSKFIQIAHKAWCDNYIFWKNLENKPVSKKYVNTSERNNRATKFVNNLDEEELEVYSDIVDIVFNIIKIQVLEAGVKSLTM